MIIVASLGLAALASTVTSALDATTECEVVLASAGEVNRLVAHFPDIANIRMLEKAISKVVIELQGHPVGAGASPPPKILLCECELLTTEGAEIFGISSLR